MIGREYIEKAKEMYKDKVFFNDKNLYNTLNENYELIPEIGRIAIWDVRKGGYIERIEIIEDSPLDKKIEAKLKSYGFTKIGENIEYFKEHKIIRTQEEILAEIKRITDHEDDFFQTKRHDLRDYLDFENAKDHFNKVFVEAVESGEEEYTHEVNPRQRLYDYLDFAYEKAENERGISANRSLEHMIVWTWLFDEEMHRIINLHYKYNYHGYGIHILDKIAKRYGYKK